MECDAQNTGCEGIQRCRGKPKVLIYISNLFKVVGQHYLYTYLNDIEMGHLYKGLSSQCSTCCPKGEKLFIFYSCVATGFLPCDVVLAVFCARVAVPIQ